ncbi:MAG TPA: hypothetical protein VHY79_05010 [Rhizomicrobium sp.]|nr:hypothetical protein [Rhizomicrobium sp.]
MLQMIRDRFSWFGGAVAAVAALHCPAAGAASEKTLYTFCSKPNCSDGNIPLAPW